MRFNVGKIFDIFTKLGQRLGFNRPRPPGERFYLYILMFFVAYLIADSTSLYLRGFMLPSGGVGKANVARSSRPLAPPVSSDLPDIKKKNIFNSDHLIAKTVKQNKAPKGSEGSEDDDNDPVKTSLPLELVGTLVHGRDEKSVATIQLKGKNEVRSYKIKEKIESMAEVKEISRNKVIFRNLNSRKLEFIEILDESKIKIGVSNEGKKTPTTAAAPPPDEKTEFVLSRAEVDKQLSNLSAILQDAKAVEYRPPGSDTIQGFKMVAIKSGSIYEKLGLKRGDVLQGVNGEDVTSPQQAMELYQALKSSDKIDLDISRGGSASTLNYEITK